MESYRHELDGLRALAMLGVLLFHLGLPQFQSGFLGVDVFFVLSGFLITRQIAHRQAENRFSFIDFYIRRARRLFPTLCFVILVTLLAGVVLLSPEHLKAASQSGLYATISVANIHYWLSAGYFDLSNVYKPFLHFWSLSVEEQFYLIWPLLIIFSGKILGLKMRIGIIILLSLLSLLAYSALNASSPNAAFFLMPFRLWEFGVGAILALANLKIGKGGAVSAIATLLGFTCVVISFVMTGGFGVFPVHYFLAVAGAGLIISAPLNGISKILLANPAVRYLGKISYSFYLWHWPVIIYLNYYREDEMTVLTMLIAVALSFALASFTYHFIENKFRKPWTQEPRFERVAVPAGLMAVVAGIVIFASHPWAQNGWPQRLSTEQRDITIASQERPNPNCKSGKQENGKPKLCIFGEQGKQVDIAIIGDSHSNALAAGLTLALQARKMTGASSSKGGMGPYMDTDFYQNAGEFRGNRTADLQALLETSPKYVLLHARYAVYWTTRPTKQDQRDLRIYLVETGQPYNRSIEDTQKVFRAGMEKSVQAVQDSGSIPVIVGPVPNPGVNMVDCLSRPLIRDLSRAVQHCPGFTKEETFARTAEVETYLKNLANETGAIYVNSNPIFCKGKNEICDRARKDKLLYLSLIHI